MTEIPLSEFVALSEAVGWVIAGFIAGTILGAVAAFFAAWRQRG